MAGRHTLGPCLALLKFSPGIRQGLCRLPHPRRQRGLHFVAERELNLGYTLSERTTLGSCLENKIVRFTLEHFSATNATNAPHASLVLTERPLSALPCMTAVSGQKSPQPPKLAYSCYQQVNDSSPEKKGSFYTTPNDFCLGCRPSRARLTCS